MAGLDLKVFPSGPLLTNNYLVFNKESKRAFIVDLAFSVELFDFLENEKLKVEFIALTHAHFDHIEGLNHTSIPFYLHKKDRQFLSDPQKNGSAFFGSIAIEKKPLFYGDNLMFESHSITVIDTPGHTPGSVSLLLGDWLFTGDTLFYESIGRTDIPLASGQLILESIRKKILVLPKKTVIYPGHGQSSTLGYEKENNPFLTTSI